MKHKIQPIKTKYNHYLFRSRTEARWAVLFDAYDCEYIYEGDGYDLGNLGWYLPDFELSNFVFEKNDKNYNQDLFIEIKSDQPLLQIDIDKLSMLNQITHQPCIFCCGQPGRHKLYSIENKKAILLHSEFALIFAEYTARHCLSIDILKGIEAAATYRFDFRKTFLKKQAVILSEMTSISNSKYNKKQLELIKLAGYIVTEESCAQDTPIGIICKDDSFITMVDGVPTQFKNLKQAKDLL